MAGKRANHNEVGKVGPNVLVAFLCLSFFFSSRRRHTRWPRDWSSDVCSSDLGSNIDALYMRGGSAQRPIFQAAQIERGDVIPVMEGRAVFKEAVSRMPDAVRSEERRVGKEWRCRGWW